MAELRRPIFIHPTAPLNVNFLALHGFVWVEKVAERPRKRV
jgi:hypothetical protein